MSFAKWAPILLIMLCNLGVVAAAHTHTNSARAALAERLAARDAAREVDRLEAEAREMARYEQRHIELQAAARVAALASLPGDPKKGRTTFMTCMSCHGLKGEGMRAFQTPRLSGQAPWYLKRQLKKFQAGVRGAHPQDQQGKQMAPMAKLLSTEQKVDDVVAYIASIDPGKPADKGKGDALKGQPTYTICSTCHGSDAGGNEQQKAPWLAGQHGWYLAKQMQNFRSGVRGYHADDAEGKLMVPQAQLLEDDQAILDLVAYITSLDKK
ncbi:MAG: c-type cytochrome [bacterium]|nr:c-type cytochrome [bacterium]